MTLSVQSSRAVCCPALCSTSLQTRDLSPSSLKLSTRPRGRASAAARASCESSYSTTDSPQFSSSPLERRSLLLLAASAPALCLGAGPALAEEGTCELTEGAFGLQYCDLVVGSGYQAERGDLIKAHYTGRLLNGTVFDTSYKRGRPLTFRVGVGEVIKGWDLGILGVDDIPPMLAGGRRTLRIPSSLAYGVRGAGCRGGSCVIPPDSDLVFEVELVGKA